MTLRERWRIWAMLNRLKDFRRIATRYDKLARNYPSAFALAAIVTFWYLQVQTLTLHLHFWRGSVSRRHHDSRIMDFGASIEATLELLASSLREVKERMRPLYTQEQVAASAGAFLDGLLGAERRKNAWMQAEAAGDPGPWHQQAVLCRGRWMPTPCATSCESTP